VEIGKKEEDITLFPGGALFTLLHRLYLCGDTMQWLRRRILLFVVLAWVPLALFTAWEGTFWNGRVPFLFDVNVHARLLLALPLLFLAEVALHRRMVPLARLFVDRGLVPQDARPRFEEAVRSAVRLRNSVVAELVLLAVVYGAGVLMAIQHYEVLGVGTWYGEPVPGKLHPTWSGWWFGFVSLPILQFLLLRWYFRIFIWLRFLWRVSKIDLRILPIHPDSCGGLGFLGELSVAFVPLLIAQGVMVSGSLANEIFFNGRKLTDFGPEIVGLIVAMILAVIGPTLVFSPRLARVKRAGFRDYGNLAQRYVSEFDRKWIQGEARPTSRSSGARTSSRWQTSPAATTGSSR
jgi:hypothetical protein